MRYVYILHLNNGKLYTGITDNLKRRITEHRGGKVTSTRYLLPAKLIHYEAYLVEEDANRRERYLKTTEGKRFLRQQLKVFFQQTYGEVPERLKGPRC